MAASLRELSDSALVISIARYKQRALEEIYRRHAGSVFALAARMVNDRQLAEDVTQEVFLKLWDAPEKFDAQRGSLRTFLLTKAHSRTIDLIRADGSRRRREDADAQNPTIEIVDLEREVIDRAVAQEVRDAFAFLPDGERAAIEMTYFKGFSYAQAARELGQPEGTVKSRIRSGLARLRQILPVGVEPV